MPAVYDRFRPGQVGAPERPGLWWRHIFSDTEYRRQGFSPLQFVLWESPAGPQGYAIYRIRENEDADGLAASEVKLLELIGETRVATEALWRYCLGIDLVTNFTAENRPVDDALVHNVADARRLRRRISDGMWVRLVDVPAALGLRRYRTEGAITVGVCDKGCPWNQGTFRLEVGPGGAECRTSSAEPDLELDAADLATAYLGTTSFHSLAAAGRVVERTPGAVARTDALFAWAPAPWCPNVF